MVALTEKRLGVEIETILDLLSYFFFLFSTTTRKEEASKKTIVKGRDRDHRVKLARLALDS